MITSVIVVRVVLVVRVVAVTDVCVVAVLVTTDAVEGSTTSTSTRRCGFTGSNAANTSATRKRTAYAPLVVGPPSNAKSMPRSVSPGWPLATDRIVVPIQKKPTSCPTRAVMVVLAIRSSHRTAMALAFSDDGLT